MARAFWLCLLLVLVAGHTLLGAEHGTLAEQMLEETNLARTAPQRYAGLLREMRHRFLGKVLRVPEGAEFVVTTEGAEAVDEAIEFLSKQRPLPPLRWSQGLAEAAAELVRDEGPSGEVGHTGGRSGDMQQRIERHGAWKSSIAENIGYGPQTARLMVLSLIVDDGVPDRGHRKNIFGREFAVAGAACGPHALYRNMCVMDFAGGFTSRGTR